MKAREALSMLGCGRRDMEAKVKTWRGVTRPSQGLEGVEAERIGSVGN